MSMAIPTSNEDVSMCKWLIEQGQPDACSSAQALLHSPCNSFAMCSQALDEDGASQVYGKEPANIPATEEEQETLGLPWRRHNPLLAAPCTLRAAVLGTRQLHQAASTAELGTACSAASTLSNFAGIATERTRLLRLCWNAALVPPMCDSL